MLKKKEKKNYLLLNIYRPIALKNILIKLAEKVLTMRIVGKAEAETLLLWNLIGGRKGRSIFLVINLLISVVQTA